MSPSLHADFEKRFKDLSVRASFSHACEGASALALFGPSGCGKTTVLRCLAGLERPELGSVRWGSETWSDASSGSFLAPQRRQAGLLFQDYALFPFLNVLENVSYGLPKASRKEASALLERFGLGGLDSRLPRELSGGQQQRAALARALFHKPRLLLLDEPLSSLDMPTRVLLRSELRQMLRSSGVPAIIVTHDPAEAMSLAERIVVMDKGRMLQEGPVEEVFSRPASQAVARIVGMETVASGRVSGGENGLVALKVGSATVYAPEPEGGINGEADVCIRADDVIIQLDGTGISSVRNRLKGVILSISQEGPLLRIAIDCGFPLTALVTRQAGAELRLSEGSEAFALFKAVSVHVIPRKTGS